MTSHTEKDAPRKCDAALIDSGICQFSAGTDCACGCGPSNSLATLAAKAFGGYNDLEWARLEPQERAWLREKGRRAVAALAQPIARAALQEAADAAAGVASPATARWLRDRANEAAQ